MSVFVADASVSLAWCFADESTSWTESLLDRLETGDQLAVPAHWFAEVSNALWMAVRRKRIAFDDTTAMLEKFGMLPIEAEPAITTNFAKDVLLICSIHNLTAYDAAYLELALRRQLALATLDTDLRKAAANRGVTLL